MNNNCTPKFVAVNKKSPKPLFQRLFNIKKT